MNSNCDKCAKYGIHRVNCTVDTVINDLIYFVNNTTLNNNELNNNVFISETEKYLHNIGDHTNMTNNDLVALLACTVLTSKKARLLTNVNKNIKINTNTNIDIDASKNNVKVTETCAICLENVESRIKATFNCNHSFCCNCVKQTIIHNKKSKPLSCYLCREKVSIINIYDDKNMYNELMNELQ